MIEIKKAFGLLAIAAALAGCTKPEPKPDPTPEDVKVTSVSLNPATLNLVEGENATLSATVLPENATDKSISWSSSDATVATVADGVVQAIAPGLADITVKTADGGKTAICKVTVEAKVYPVESVSLDKTTATLTEGQSLTLTAMVLPENASNKNLLWSSSDATVATVTDGLVEAVAPGEADITVTTEDGGKTAVCKVVVEAKVYPVTGVSLNKTELTLTEGDNATLTETITPANATNKNVTWSSSKPAVATVDQSGKVTAVAPGEATITVTTSDGGKTAECKVTVVAKVYPVTGVSLNKTSLDLTEGDTETLTATVAPANATNKNVSWSSDKPGIASVDNGTVTGVAVGSAVITVTTEDGSFKASCTVTVTDSASGGLEDPQPGGEIPWD